jgi:hypothetical protein
MFRNPRAVSVLAASLMFAVFNVLPSQGGDELDGAAEPSKDSAPSVWMKKKLDYSQGILSGLATADFDKIAKNAQAMEGLSKIEGFVRARTPGYRKQLDIFMEANAEIIRQAERDNVDGAALAFTQMTISCVNCHKRLREQTDKPGNRLNR